MYKFKKIFHIAIPFYTNYKKLPISNLKYTPSHINNLSLHCYEQVFKIIGSLLIGASLGFAVATLFIIFTTDLTLKEFLGKFSNVELLEMCGVVLFSIIGFLVTLVLHITAHEGGHLAAGLLTGYKFVSFRIFSITFIRSARGIVIKRFKIGGTGGQCLLSPPLRNRIVLVLSS